MMTLFVANFVATSLVIYPSVALAQPTSVHPSRHFLVIPYTPEPFCTLEYQFKGLFIVVL